MTEIVQDDAKDETTATPGLSAIIAKRVEAQAIKAVAEHEVAITITHTAEYDNPNHPATYRIEFEGKLTNEQRMKLQKDSTRFPVVGLTWLVYKPTFPRTDGDDESEAETPASSPSAPDPITIASEQPLDAPKDADGTVDPKDTRIAELEAQIAELTAQRLASQPAIAEAIREELRTFPAEPGTRYFVGEISDSQNQNQTARQFDAFERDCDLVHEEFKAFDVGQLGKFYHVARGKRRSIPTENGATAKVFAAVDMPEQPTKTATRGKIIQDAAPLVSVFTNLMRRNPLVEEVWTRGPDAVMEDMLAEGNRRAVDFIFEHLTPRDTLALVEVDDLQ